MIEQINDLQLSICTNIMKAAISLHLRSQNVTMSLKST